MTRDIQDRMEMFMGGIELKRLALNMDQVKEYNPPANPAKTTDSRYAGYIAEFGEESWELDALEPPVIAALIRSAVMALVDNKKWRARQLETRKARALLRKVASEMASSKKPKR